MVVGEAHHFRVHPHMHVGRHQQSMDVHLWGQPVVGARAMDYDTLLLDDNRRLWWKTMTVGCREDEI